MRGYVWQQQGGVRTETGPQYPRCGMITKCEHEQRYGIYIFGMYLSLSLQGFTILFLSLTLKSKWLTYQYETSHV